MVFIPPRRKILPLVLFTPRWPGPHGPQDRMRPLAPLFLAEFFLSSAVRHAPALQASAASHSAPEAWNSDGKPMETYGFWWGKPIIWEVILSPGFNFQHPLSIFESVALRPDLCGPTLNECWLFCPLYSCFFWKLFHRQNPTIHLSKDVNWRQLKSSLNLFFSRGLVVLVVSCSTGHTCSICLSWVGLSMLIALPFVPKLFLIEGVKRERGRERETEVARERERERVKDE